MKTKNDNKMSFKALPESFTASLADTLIDKSGIKPGEIICDPFAGAGFVGLRAALRGIPSINIEVNPKTFSLLKSNFSLLKKIASPLPNYQLILNDSETAIINKKILSIITSPPFTLSKTERPPKSEKEYLQYINRLGCVFKKFLPMLEKDSTILVVIGKDRFKGQEIAMDRLFIREMQTIGYRLVSSELIPNSICKASIITFTPLLTRQFIDLTKEVVDKQKVWPGFPKVSVKRFQTIKGQGWNGTYMSFPVHELTHIDYPYHTFEKGQKSLGLPLSTYFGTGRVVTDPQKLPDTEFLLFPKSILVTEEIVAKIINLRKVRFVGTECDTLTPEGAGDGALTHKELLSRNIFIIENLTNLSLLPKGKSVQVIAIPLKLNADGVPIRVIAKI